MDHLTVVPNGNVADGGTGDDGDAEAKTRKRPSIQRTSRPLPTDRMKFEKQEEALRAFARASGPTREPVGASAIATRIGLIEATARLVNSFFQEAGFIERVQRGMFVPTDAVIAYAREYSFDPVKAANALSGPLKESWYWRAIASELAAGKAPEETIIRILADAADTDNERRAQLDLVLDWLQYGGLITRKDGFVTARGDQATTPLEPGTAVIEPDPKKPEDKTPRERPTVETPSVAEKPSVGKPVVEFSFALSLSAEDLIKLDPAQIKALFEAVGTIMAVKGATAE